ncbi:MAG: site-2 protease family protein [Verrucomicrobiales bacterium]|nr:site-2 protease family protein [Verrucomicrobiales bacterium]
MPREKTITKSRTETIAAILIFAIGVPAMILLHELGHYLAAISFGHKAHLSFASVFYVSTEGRIPQSHHFWITAAGPFANLGSAIVAVFALRRFTKTTERSKYQWWLIWIISVFVSAGGRGFVKVFSPEGADEAYLAVHLGMPEIAGPLIMAVPSIVFAFFLFRFHWLNSSLGTLLLGWAGGICGMTLWLKVIGRMVMP